MNKKKLGIITIGQSPRTDLTCDILKVLNDNISIVEIGVLDNYSLEEVQKEFAVKHNTPRLVTRMRDGTQVIIDEEKIIKELDKLILEFEQKVDLVLLLCTGKFPEFKSNKTLIIPKPIVYSLVRVISKGKKIGVVIPDISQKEYITKWWNDANVNIETCVCSPYRNDNAIDNINFVDKKIEYIVLDCMGYSIKMKDKIEKITGKHVILPRTLLASVINELI